MNKHKINEAAYLSGEWVYFILEEIPLEAPYYKKIKSIIKDIRRFQNLIQKEIRK